MTSFSKIKHGCYILFNLKFSQLAEKLLNEFQLLDPNQKIMDLECVFTELHLI